MNNPPIYQPWLTFPLNTKLKMNMKGKQFHTIQNIQRTVTTHHQKEIILREFHGCYEKLEGRFKNTSLTRITLNDFHYNFFFELLFPILVLIAATLLLWCNTYLVLIIICATFTFNLDNNVFLKHILWWCNAHQIWIHIFNVSDTAEIKIIQNEVLTLLGNIFMLIFELWDMPQLPFYLIWPA